MLQHLTTSKRIYTGLLLSGIFFILTFVLAIRLSNGHLESTILQSTFQSELQNIHDSKHKDTLWLPESSQIFGFLASHGDVPSDFIKYGEGQYHDVLWQGQHFHLFVEPFTHKLQSKDMLYLAIKINALERYKEQLNWLLSISAITLLILLLWIAYWLTSLISKPLLQLSHQVSQLSTEDEHLPDTIHDEDLLPIINAINQFLEKIQQYIKHEKLFSDIANHELRTPLSTIRTSLDTYISNLDTSAIDERQLARIQRVKRTVVEMQYINESLLYLIKHQQNKPEPGKIYEMLPLLSEVISEQQALVRNKQVELVLIKHGSPKTDIPQVLLKPLVGNLLRNTLENTFSGTVSLHLYDEHIIIEDTGKCITGEMREWINSGSLEAVQDTPVAIGLYLVAKLCEQLNWSFSVLEGQKQNEGNQFQLKW